MRVYERYTEKELKDIGLYGGIPAHVGIIMDGNGRWAKKRLMPRSFGHRAGMEALHGIVREAHCLGIKALTVYAFSTENWQRPVQEVNALFSLLTEYFEKEIDELDLEEPDEQDREDIAPLIKKYMRPGDDDLIRKALEVAILDRKMSTSYLQRRLKIGYNRAAEIVDLLEERQVVGPPSGSGNKREILIFDGTDFADKEDS